MKRARQLSIVLLALLSIFAARRGYSDESKLTIGLPKSRTSFDAMRNAEASGEHSQLSLAVAWHELAPMALEVESRVIGTSPFSRGKLPGVSLAWHLGLLRVGAGFEQLERSAQWVMEGGLRQSATQALYLVPLQFGAEMSPEALAFSTLKPYGALSISPTFALLSGSALLSGNVSLGVPVELLLGTRFGLLTQRLGSDIELDLAVAIRRGSVHQWNLSNVAVQTGVRVAL